MHTRIEGATRSWAELGRGKRTETGMIGDGETISRPGRWLAIPTLVVLGIVLSSCGGSSSSPTSPSSGTGPVGATITIGSNGAVTPSTVTINVGEVVAFVNNDSRPHEMASNPHPAHTDCPAINAVSQLQPGQSRNTGNFTTARSCGFHDHSNPDSAALQGTITVR